MKKIFLSVVFFVPFFMCAQDTCIEKKDYDSIGNRTLLLKEKWDKMLKQHPGSFPERRLMVEYNAALAQFERLITLLKENKAKYCSK